MPVATTANLPDRRRVKVPLRTPVADSPPPADAPPSIEVDMTGQIQL